MIKYTDGNLLDSEADILVNAVNCVGVMGKGIALEFKTRYPEMFESYRALCQKGDIQVGRLFLWKGPKTKPIFNFPTKEHWKNKSEIEWIDNGLQVLRKSLLEVFPDKSIAIPKLGCDNGGLNWEDIKPLVVKHLGDLDNDIYIYEGRSHATDRNNLGYRRRLS
mgnify:CR=1 FL=1